MCNMDANTQECNFDGGDCDGTTAAITTTTTTTITTLTTSQKECFLHDVNYFGFDIGNGGLLSSAKQCQMKCQDFVGCEHFSWVMPDATHNSLGNLLLKLKF